ncbi:MAG: ribonuclease H-like domain-containing protein, partial [Patescibacteria group bacterium]|nr:ribonuclease H-like domain-containing protein [Patescibacteria group bacterium]
FLKVSVAVAYSYPENKFLVFDEKTVHKLGELLADADLVIGYNIINFDYEVLRPYLNYDLKTLPTLDMLLEVEKILGHRVGLDSIAEATLGGGKIASGLDAIRFWRNGELDKLKEYCVSDVKITRDIYNYVKQNQKLFYKDFFTKKEFRIVFPEATEKTDKQRQVSLF